LTVVSPALHPVERGAAGAEEHALDSVDSLMVRMFALVSEGLAAATEAFLLGDRAIARDVVAGDRDLDDLQLLVEELVERRLAHGRPAEPREVRLLISILRIAPELERSGDLIEHIALRTPQRLTDGLTPRARGLLADMGSLASTLWSGAADAYVDRDPARVDQLRIQDDALDDLHVEFTAELAKGETSIAEAIELGLIARFYERLGDHAVNVARRIRYLTDG
jgi:phosphate transport system protein